MSLTILVGVQHMIWNDFVDKCFIPLTILVGVQPSFLIDAYNDVLYP